MAQLVGLSEVTFSNGLMSISAKEMTRIQTLGNLAGVKLLKCPMSGGRGDSYLSVLF